jgi:hypothetical protein
MDTWPISLQSKLETNGFTKKLGDTTVSTDMGVGPAKRRARFTRGIDVYTCQVTLDFSEVQTFETFYKTTLGNGVLPFTFTDPFTETTSTYRFQPDSSPSIVPLGGRKFTLSMVWENIPS